MRSLLLALVCLAVASAAEEFVPHKDHDSDESEKPLIRCKRPICPDGSPMCSEYEYVNGCQTCNCKDKCEGYQCNRGEKCTVSNGQPRCILDLLLPDQGDCGDVKCTTHCVFGFRTDERGCEICECKETPCDGFTCLFGMKCISKEEPCDGGDCSLQAACVPEPIQPLPCPIPMCAVDHECKFGFKNNEHGCQTCQCRDTPCDSEKCPEGEVCTERKQKCNKDYCPNQAQCVGKPLCNRQAELHHLASSLLMPGPALFGSLPRTKRETPAFLECDENGNFQPLQCNPLTAECWCVDDRGFEIPETRSKEGKPECHYNRTRKVHGSFKLTHSLDDVKHHMGNIKQLAHQHLSHWLRMDEEYVTIVEIMPRDIHIIQVRFEVLWDEQTDMATAVYHVQYLMLKGRCQINYQGSTLTPDPKTMEVHHHYDPQLPDESGWTGHAYPHRYGFMGFVHRHQTGIIAAVFGATMLILLFAIVSFVKDSGKEPRWSGARRRRLNSPFNHRRMATYKENLAFSNQLYGKQNLMPEDIKEPLPDVDTQPASETKKADDSMA